MMKLHALKHLIGAGLIAGAGLLTGPAYGLEGSNLALTPPMGWSSWNYFGCTGTPRTAMFPGGGISETKVLQVADAMVKNGLKDAGYIYVNLDDCFLENSRDSKGGLVAKKSTFPGGIKKVADAIHAKGMKFGVYSCIFEKTCADQYDGKGNGQPGLWNHEKQDADTFVAWGVDYVKVDWCGFEKYFSLKSPLQQRIDSATKWYSKVGTALKQAVVDARINGNPNAREMVFSICEWGDAQPKDWAPKIGHMWRTRHDIELNWTSFMGQVNGILADWQVHRPGSWNDPDMMHVGNGLPDNEDRVHLALWSVMAAPMIAGNNITNMTNNTVSLLSNREVGFVNQDSLGYQGRLVKGSTTTQFVISKKLKNGEYAVAMVNANPTSSASITVSWAEVFTVDPGNTIPPTEKFYIRDLVNKAWVGEAAGTFTRSVPAKDVFYFRMSPTQVVRELQPVGIRADARQASKYDFSVRQVADRLSLTGPAKVQVTFSVFDNRGRLVMHSGPVSHGTWGFSNKSLIPGAYAIVMDAPGGSVNRIFVNK